MPTTTPDPPELTRILGPVQRRFVALASAASVSDETSTLAFGVRHATQGGQVDERTVFEIGSITKVFTALLLADQVVAGAVGLDEPLQDLLPDVRLPVRGRPVTLVDLATHTAGFPRLPSGLLRQSLRTRDDPYSLFTEEDLVRALEGVRLRREPGTHVAYSNFGAATLGHALARRAGSTYEALLAERVTGPLGLDDTVVTLRADQEPRRAHGHARRRRPVPDWSMPTMPAMGALHSTVADLGAFLAAQLDPDSSPLAEAIRLTHEPRAGHGFSLQAVGWAVAQLPRGGPRVHWHNGGTGGARSWAGFCVDERRWCVILTTGGRSPDRYGFPVVSGRA